MFTPQMPEPYMPAGIPTATAQTPYYPGTSMDPGRVPAGLPVPTVAPSALSKGT